MSIIAAGTPAPEFSLRREDGAPFTRADLRGQTVVLVFYPFAFSPVCTDQLQIYEEALGEIRRAAPRSTASRPTPRRRRRRSGRSSASTIPQLSDFEPKGATARRSARTSSPAG